MVEEPAPAEESVAEPIVKEPVAEETAPAKKPELSAAELTDLLQRTQANFENYRKQTEKRYQEIKGKAAKDLILQLLPVLDNFDLALRNATTAKAEDLLKGIELIYAQLASLLENNGVKVIKALERFNPYQHEALLKVESEQPEGTILEVFQNGFTLSGEVIRPAKVKVSAGQKNETKVTSNETMNHN